MKTKWIVSIDDYRRAARRKLPKMIYDYLEGGALDESTLRANRASLDGLLLRQRNFVDLTGLDTSTSLLGTRVELPLLVSPMGMLTIFDPGSDVAVANAAAAAGSIFVHSAWAGCSIEEVVASTSATVWAQVGIWKDAREVAEYVDRVEALGLDTLVVAGDVSSSSKRERDLHHGMSMPPRPPVVDYLRTATKPGWVWKWRTGRPMTYGNYSVDSRPMNMSEMNQWMAGNKNKAVTWADIGKLRRRWTGKIVIKGIMNGEDAGRAVDEGVDAVFVSNHGGRQFDAQPATIDVLPEVVEAVGGRAQVYLDGGIRRGHDIVKAIAFGADAVMAGRPFASALAASGQRGVEHAFSLYRDELIGAMGFVGARHVSEIDRSVLRHGAGHDRTVSPYCAVSTRSES